MNNKNYKKEQLLLRVITLFLLVTIIIINFFDRLAPASILIRLTATMFWEARLWTFWANFFLGKIGYVRVNYLFEDGT